MCGGDNHSQVRALYLAGRRKQAFKISFERILREWQEKASVVRRESRRLTAHIQGDGDRRDKNQ